jgi:hypothetical protein
MKPEHQKGGNDDFEDAGTWEAEKPVVRSRLALTCERQKLPNNFSEKSIRTD